LRAQWRDLGTLTAGHALRASTDSDARQMARRRPCRSLVSFMCAAGTTASRPVLVRQVGPVGVENTCSARNGSSDSLQAESGLLIAGAFERLNRRDVAGASHRTEQERCR
jgi:hypothetical protein